jgi:hypothetical protein
VGDHGCPDNIGHLKPRIEDGVYKDGYALHCYHVALEGIYGGGPGEKWGGVWDCVREQIQRRGFRGMARGGCCLGGVSVDGNG